MIEVVHNIVGFAGSGLIILAYLLLQTEKLSSDQPAYSIMNLIGAASVIFSLAFEFNLAAFVLEAFWVVISVVGLVRVWSPGKTSSQ